jgi:hypothetical protein
MKLRSELFWDVDINEIDLDLHKQFIIERTALRGYFIEFKEIRNFYTDEVVKNTLINSKWLDKKTLSYCSILFEIPKEEFRCYKLGQLNQEHWSY